MGELALLIYVDTRLFNSLYLFFPVHVCQLFFFSEIIHPPLKKTVGLFREFLMEKFLPLLLRKRQVLGRIRPVLYFFLLLVICFAVLF